MVTAAQDTTPSTKRHDASQAGISNADLHTMLKTIAAIYEIKGKSRFQIVAYQKAAETVEMLSRPLQSVWAEGRLAELPGMGSSIGKHVDELFRTGTSTHFQEILAMVPPTLPVLMKVPNIGPKKAFTIIDTFDLTNPETVLEDVRKLARKGKLADLPRFGEKSQRVVLDSIEIAQQMDKHQGRMPYPIAYDVYQTVANHLRTHAAVEQVEAMGSLRRGRETIGDVDLVAMATDEQARSVVEHFIAMPGKLSVENAGDHKASIMMPPGVRVDLRVESEAQFGSMLQYFTGSKQHNIELREFARSKGLSLSEYGIKNVSTDQLQKTPTETEFYNALGLEYIPPELREAQGEIEAARKGTLPELVTVEQVNGDFHIHSSYDINTSHDLGIHTYAEIVDKAVERGYKYVGFADHNPKQSGLSEKEIVTIMQERKKAIHKQCANAKIDWYISLEVDILPDGSLALPEAAYDTVDYLVVSLHSALTKPKDEQTQRILRALSHPKVRIMGHPTARYLGRRPGVEADWDAVFAEAAQRRIAMEINASPKRLDLPDSLVRQAQKAGCLFSIDTDAHDVDHMDAMPYGVTVARRGWLTTDDVVNTWDPARLREWITGG